MPPDNRERDRHHRPRQRGDRAPINPTSIYSPGGLIGPPRDVRAPAPAEGRAAGDVFGYAEPAAEPGEDRPAWGEYAQVIHVDRPQPSRGPAAAPQAAPPAVPPEPELTDVFVYRDPDDAAQPEQDAAAHARGPFEPLRHEAQAEPPAGHEASEPAPASQPRERITDRYAAAEPISEERTGRHFNGLLRRQRELISEYFKGPPGIAKPASFGAGDAGGDGGGAAGVGDQEMVASEQQGTD